jgi:hypothetical protein
MRVILRRFHLKTGPNTVSETMFYINDRTMDNVEKCDSYRIDEKLL